MVVPDGHRVAVELAKAGERTHRVEIVVEDRDFHQPCSISAGTLERDDFTSSRSRFLLAYNLFRKPVPTFRDHALAQQKEILERTSTLRRRGRADHVDEGAHRNRDLPVSG